MPTTLAPPEEKVLLCDVSWETYERLLSERKDSPGTRFFYDEGVLEIMVVGVAHENANWALARLAEIVAEETGRDFYAAGGATFRRSDLKKGFEPDACFYLANAGLIRRKKEVDLTVDPPPDLMMEVDITRSSLPRMPIFAAIGVPEIWRYDGERVAMYRLEAGAYRQIETSVELPILTAAQATVLLESSRSEKSAPWMRKVREWVRSAR